jgi:uncharacterized protein (TIGR00730 family)
MSPPSRLKGEFLSAQREGSPVSGARRLTTVCVFCGSQPGARPAYVEATRELGALLAARGIDVVYGGGQVGLMGALAAAALAAGGRVTGIIPQHLMQPEVAHGGLTELAVVDSMHTRKRLMAERSDAFIVLPGGFGTFEEMFEMITWLQLDLQAKPVGILNLGGYYDRLLDFLRYAASEGFIRPQHADLLIVESSASRLLERLRLYQHATAGPVAPNLDRS